MNDYIIYISKKRSPDDKFGIYWAKVELPDCDEEKATAKFDLLRVLMGDTFVVTLTIMSRGYVRGE